jgi:uncharacterized protein (DUF58 family)
VSTSQESSRVFTVSLRNRTLQLTREGGGFIFLIFGVGLGAINTGNNLLYLVLAMCCSLVAVSGVLSELALKKITVTVRLKGGIYAEDPCPLSFIVKNNKNKIPSYSLTVDFPSNLFANARLENPANFFQVAPGAFFEKTVRFIASQRGWLKINSCKLSTSFPFGFFIKTKTVPIQLETLIYPAIQKLDLPKTFPSGEGAGKLIRSTGTEIGTIREFKPGDPLNSIHWKTTAKTGELRTKEFTAEGSKKISIFLNVQDNQTGKTIDPLKLERRVSETASLIFHLIQRGDQVKLHSEDFESSYDNTQVHLAYLMNYLATAGLNDHQSKSKLASK